MLTRIAGDAVEAVLLVSRLVRATRRWSASAWRMFPGDALGRLVIALCGAQPTGRTVDAPGGGTATLVADPRLALYLDAAPLRPYAQTLGAFVLSREPLPEATVRHELVHVRQWARLGPLFLPLYGAGSLRAMLRGGDPYRDNVFEIAARAAEPEAG